MASIVCSRVEGFNCELPVLTAAVPSDNLIWKGNNTTVDLVSYTAGGWICRCLPSLLPDIWTAFHICWSRLGEKGWHERLLFTMEQFWLNPAHTVGKVVLHRWLSKTDKQTAARVDVSFQLCQLFGRLTTPQQGTPSVETVKVLRNKAHSSTARTNFHTLAVKTVSKPSVPLFWLDWLLILLDLPPEKSVSSRARNVADTVQTVPLVRQTKWT